MMSAIFVIWLASFFITDGYYYVEDANGERRVHYGVRK